MKTYEYKINSFPKTTFNHQKFKIAQFMDKYST